MASNYDLIREENLREYGQGTRHLAFLGRLYTDRTHFLFELLQNAEDARATRILFTVLPDRLEVLHDGRPFNEADVRGLCGVGEGTKAEDLTQIGKFGIGFKSVYAYTAAPEIYSGKESFKIEYYVRPFALPRREIPSPWTTLFVLPFNANSIAPETACQEIGIRLGSLEAKTLLFLRHIQEIEYRLADATGCYLREEQTQGQGRRVTVIGQNNGQEEEEHWLLFSQPVPLHDGSLDEHIRVEVAFKLERPGKADTERIVRVSESPLVVFFPTEQDTRLGFLIQGPYRTTPARDNIPKDDAWNKQLVAATAKLVVETLRHLKAMGLLTVSLLETLPIRMADFPVDGRFSPLATAVQQALRTEELLPAADGTYVAAAQAKLARSAALRQLLNDEQLRDLFATQTPLRWLSADITQDRTPDLHHYLTKTLEIEEVTPDSLAPKISKPFLAKQSDAWFIDFYAFLADQKALWRASFGSKEAGLLRHQPIIRLEDDHLIAPFHPGDSAPQAYLPPPEDSDFPTVKRSIANNEAAKNFLTSLGLTEPDICAEVTVKILPKYNQGPPFPTAAEHQKDLPKILKALHAGREEGRKQVIAAAQETPCLAAVNLSQEKAYKKPGELYLPTPELETYFAGNAEVWFLAESDGIEKWQELGVADKPRFIKISGDLSWEEKSRLRRGACYTREVDCFDYRLEGLENFLSNLSEHQIFINRCALVLWNFLVSYIKETNFYFSFFKGKYVWFYYSQRYEHFNAHWEKLLSEHAWLPKEKTPGLFRPGELRLSDLPDEFEKNQRLAGILGLQSDRLAALAAEAGVPVEYIELIKNHPAEFADFKKELTKRAQRPDFPEKPVHDSRRRQAEIEQEYANSPEKKFAERGRTIRVSQNTIEPETWLRETYTNSQGQMICQICQQEMPFKKRDGQYYFEAVEMLTEKYFPKEHEAQYLALCPLCAAKYKEFVKRDDAAQENLCRDLQQHDDSALAIQLGEEQATLRFVATHRADVRTILESEDNDRSTS